jgi:hypothetical protein
MLKHILFVALKRLKLCMHIFSKISSLVESHMGSTVYTFQYGRKKFINKWNLFRSFSFKYIFRRSQSLTYRFLVPL